MSLLRGEAAKNAITSLRQDRAVPVLCVDPLASRSAPPSVWTLATPKHAVLIDASDKESVMAAIEGGKPVGAFDAKRLHRMLLGNDLPRGSIPSRWACLRLSEQLIAGGRDWQLTPDSIGARLGLPKPPRPESGLDAMAAYARWLAEALTLQIDDLKRDNLTRVSKLEASAVAPVAEMEHFGMGLDAARWRSLNKEAQEERTELRKALSKMFESVTGQDLFGGTAINLDNDHELKPALHALGHNVPNVRRATILRLPKPLGPALSRYRELAKIVTAYGETFLQCVDYDGRVRPSFEQIGASTGRMACHSPNLQAIPKDAPHRTCFRCPPERRLITADYATCELRILAEMSQDPVFMDAFSKGDDLHSRVASNIFGVKVSKTERPDLRQRAKAINFGLCYGMGPSGLARSVGTSVDQARDLLNKYFRTFPSIGAFLGESSQQALERGYCETLCGRRLYLDLTGDSSAIAAAQRVAKNMPIQGTNADVVKIALGRLRQRLGAFEKAWVVNAVHDEIVVECNTADAEAVAGAVQEEMQGAGAEVLRRVRLEVDVAVDTIWNK